jgi:hypothetical protein
MITRARPSPGRYRHYKGGVYDVIAVARHTESEEEFVIYRLPVEPTTTWARPVEVFASLVGQGDRARPRFERIEE